MNDTLKNGIVGTVIGGALLSGGILFLENKKESSTNSFAPARSTNTYTRDDNPFETRSEISVGIADMDCADFSSQYEAQEFFESEGGPDDDPHNLDRDGDGIVCESL